MIDKRIFYCWFGSGELSALERACIQSWKVMCPDYEIVRISEDNFNVNVTEYCRNAYLHKNYSFVSDVARLIALKERSGFYLDTDIRLVQSLDGLRGYDAIMPMSGIGFYNSAPLACDEFPALYQDALDNLVDGRCLNELMNSLVYQRYDVHGQQKEVEDNIAFLGNEYFITAGYSQTENTVGIHYCLGSWLDAWKGSYDKSKTFKAFEIYQDDIRDKKTEQKVYGDLEKTGTFKTFGTPFKKDYIFYGNFFYNPKVMRVVGEHFEIARYNAQPAAKKFHVDGVVLECVE